MESGDKWTSLEAAFLVIVRVVIWPGDKELRQPCVCFHRQTMQVRKRVSEDERWDESAYMVWHGMVW